MTPGSLYNVTDEQKVERSSGLAWESYSSSTVLPSNLAYTDVANVFTQDQTVSKVLPRWRWYDTAGAVDSKLFVAVANAGNLLFASLNDAATVVQAYPLTLYRDGRVEITKAARPELILTTTGTVAKARLQVATANDAFVCSNLRYDAPNSEPRWTALIGTMVGLDNAGGFAFYTATAGANPRTLATPFTLTNAGIATFTNQVRLPSINPTLQFGGTTAAYTALRAGNDFGFPGYLEVTTADTPASAYAPLRASKFVSTTSGNNLGDLTCNGAMNVGGATGIAGRLTLTGGSTGSYAAAPLEIQMAGNPRIGFHWPAVVASQIGMDSAGTIRTFDNPGTGFAAFSCGGLVASGNIQSTTNTWVSNIHTTGYVFPGDYAAGTVQSAWYFAGHSSYGLYSKHWAVSR